MTNHYCTITLTAISSISISDNDKMLRTYQFLAFFKEFLDMINCLLLLSCAVHTNKSLSNTRPLTSVSEISKPWCYQNLWTNCIQFPWCWSHWLTSHATIKVFPHRRRSFLCPLFWRNHWFFHVYLLGEYSEVLSLEIEDDQGICRILSTGEPSLPFPRSPQGWRFGDITQWKFLKSIAVKKTATLLPLENMWHVDESVK